MRIYQYARCGFCGFGPHPRGECPEFKVGHAAVESIQERTAWNRLKDVCRKFGELRRAGKAEGKDLRRMLDEEMKLSGVPGRNKYASDRPKFQTIRRAVR